MIRARLGALNLALATIILTFSLFGWAQSAHSVEVISVEGDEVSIEIRKASLIRLETPVAAVFVADPAIADVQVKSPRLIYVFGLAVGETTFFAIDENEEVIAKLLVKVSHNLTRLREAISSLAPTSGVKVNSIDGAIVMEGIVDSPALATNLRQLVGRFVSQGEAVIDRLKISAPNQVNLRVRVAEVSRSAIKELGVNWDAVFTGTSFLFGLATGNPVLAAGEFATRSNAANSVFGSFTNDTLDVNGLIDALANEGLLYVLAEPNLTAMSGETASFLAGGEFPIPVPGNNGGVTITFKQFGVQLAFTPVLLGDARISLRVRPEVSQLSTSGAVQIDTFLIPALTTRRAETTVELASGQSFAIAGLLSANTNQDISKFPGLGDVPVLGSLFRSETFLRDESELVIIITPYLVRPVIGRDLASPTDGLAPPNDIERILMGRNYGEGTGETADEEPDETHLQGPAGFMVE